MTLKRNKKKNVEKIVVKLLLFFTSSQHYIEEGNYDLGSKNQSRRKCFHIDGKSNLGLVNKGGENDFYFIKKKRIERKIQNGNPCYTHMLGLKLHFVIEYKDKKKERKLNGVRLDDWMVARETEKKS